jgi:hypothetical protein
MAAAYEYSMVSNAGRVRAGATTSLWERVLVAAGICLPIPVLALTGLSIPLPVTVERLAASLVPWAHAGATHANEALERGSDGEIVLSNGDRIVLVRAADGSTRTALVTRRGRPTAAGRRGVDAVGVGSTSPDPDRVAAGAPGAAGTDGEAGRHSGGGAAAAGSAPATSAEPGGSAPAIDSPPAGSAPAPTSEPQPPAPNPTTTPPKEEPAVVETTVTTVNETVSTATETVQPVTDKVESTTTQVVDTTKSTVGGLVPGAGG